MVLESWVSISSRNPTFVGNTETWTHRTQKPLVLPHVREVHCRTDGPSAGDFDCS